MEICSSGHEEICFSSHKCPLCEALEEKNDLQKEIKNGEDKIDVLEDQVETLKETITDLKCQIGNPQDE